MKASDQRLCCADSTEDETTDWCDCGPWCACTDCGHDVGDEPKAIASPVSVTTDFDLWGDAIAGIQDASGRDVLLWNLSEGLWSTPTRARQTVADLRAMAAALNAREELVLAREELALARAEWVALEAWVKNADPTQGWALLAAAEAAAAARKAFYTIYPERLEVKAGD